MTVQWRGSEIIRKVRAAALRGVIRGTESVRDEATSLIDEAPATGRIYERRSVTHQASAPGEPPAADTGTLAREIQVSYDLPRLTGIINAGAGYSAALEWGTNRIAARPFMRPALANKAPEIETDIAMEIRSALR